MRDISPHQLDFGAIVRTGERVAWTSGTGEPLSLSERLVEQRHAIGKFRLFLGTMYSNTLLPEHCDTIEVLGLGAVGTARRLAAAGAMNMLPVHMSELGDAIRSKRIDIDVALIQVAEDPDTGELSYGAVNFYTHDLVQAARVVVAEINETAPYTFSSQSVPKERIALAVRSRRPILEISEQAVDEVSASIGRHVAEIVPDRAVLQIGVGAIPRAVMSALRNHRDLGLLSGMIGDSVIPLVEAGVITNAYKTVDRGISHTGTLLGSKKLYRFAHRNKALKVEPVSVTHAFDTLRACPRFTSINSALEVDLTGQVNSEVAENAYVGTVGGQLDFARGAGAADHGLAIVAVPALTKSGKSRIVPRIASGVVTMARSDVDYVVTEFGAVQLRGHSLSERARRLISIAHPDRREELERAAHEFPGVSRL